MRRHLLAITAAALVVSSLVTSNLGCGGDSPPAGSNGDAELAADVTPNDTGPRDSGPRDTEQADGVSPDTGVGDVESDVDADADGDAPSTGRTLADYRRCTSNLDCPVGLGTCVKEVTLNRPDADGTETIALNEIFSGLGADEGVCTLECTNNPGACAGLSMNGTTADPVAHTCQLIATGEAPYPTNAPSLPLDEPIEPAEMAAGQPFAAICRPPFELDDSVDNSFCAPCDGPDACGDDGLCWSLTDLIPAQAGESGLCLTPCSDDASCPLGFVCDATDDASQTYCRPETYTCTNCRDHDQDGFGTGHCGPSDDLVSAHDCDDRDARAYYDPDDMNHPFPATCGPQDYNCNGLSDDDEITDTDEHCGACFATCSGASTNGALGCTASDDGTGAVCGVVCDEGFADCDGDPSNGCEVDIHHPSAADIGRYYFSDADRDGVGIYVDIYDSAELGAALNAGDAVYVCDSLTYCSQAADTPCVCDGATTTQCYVPSSADCDDNDDATYFGADEICDGVDNDCNPSTDETVVAVSIGDACDSGEPGVCRDGAKACTANGTTDCTPIITPGSQTEVCDGVDNDCDGEVDEAGADGSIVWYEDLDQDGFGDPSTATSQTFCDADSDNPHTFPVSQAGDCDDTDAAINPNAPEQCGDFVDNDCDGDVNEGSAVDANTYYRDEDGDGYGVDSATTTACSVPSGYAVQGGDCNDDPTLYTNHTPVAAYGSNFNPGHSEVCDGHDNDCDGRSDEFCPGGTFLWDGAPFSPSGNTIGNPALGAWSGHQGGDYSPTCPTDKVWAKTRVNYFPGTYPVVWIKPGCHGLVGFNPPSTDTFKKHTWDDVQQVGFYTDWQGGHTGNMGPQTDTFECPHDSAIYKVRIEYGTVIDKVEFFCRSYRIQDLNGSYTIESGAQTYSQSFGGEGANAASQECGNGQVAVGAHLQSAVHEGKWSLVRLRLRCVDLTPALIGP